MFDKLANVIEKHPKTILAIWIVALLVALPVAMNYGNVLDYDMTNMSGNDSESNTGSEIIADQFYSGSTAGIIVAVTYNTAEEKAEIFGTLLSPTDGLQSHLDTFYGKNATTVLDMGSYNKNGDSSKSGVLLISIELNNTSINNVDCTPDIRNIVSDTKEDTGCTLTTYVTGMGALTYDTKISSTDDISKIDPFSILLILILIGLFFSAIVTAVVPPTIVGMAYGLVLALVFCIGGVLDIFYITTIIVLVSMLGAGCDYSIFIISRYREERKKGVEKDAALKEAVNWAGESVATSGLAVVIGFAVLSCCSFSLVSTMGIILAIGIIMAMLAALTFVPALIAVVGDKIFWPRKIEDYESGSHMRNGIFGKLTMMSRGYFKKVAQTSIKHAKVIVLIFILISVPLTYVTLTSETSYDMISVMPDSESTQGVHTIVDNAYGGYLMPTYAVIELDESIATVNNADKTLTWTATAPTLLAMSNTICGGLTADNENVDTVLGPTEWKSIYDAAYDYLVSHGETPTTEKVNRFAFANLPEMIQPAIKSVFDVFGYDADPSITSPYIDYVVNIGAGLVSFNGMYIDLMVIQKDEPLSQLSMDTIDSIRGDLTEYKTTYDAEIVDTWVTGTPAETLDISNIVNDQFKWIEIGVIVLIFVLLFFVLGSYLSPIRSLFTIMMSISWTIALTTLLFTDVMGTPITWIIPIVLFVVCLGLGMDYDILMTTRIREGKKKGLSNDEAIINAVEMSGGIITLCGMIMGGTFLTLLVSHSALLQEFGFALGIAILIDSLIVVTYVVPALMHLMGDWSWKGPKFLHRN